MKHTIFWLLSVCLILCSFHSYSQTAKFTADTHSGCAPLVLVTFTNQSSGFSAAAKYMLNFGDGGGDVPFSGSNTTLTHTYSNPQTYIVTLTVTDGTVSPTDTEKIVVYKSPTVAFAPSTTKACVNSSVNFNSTSTAGDGTIAKYLWDFGDGVVLDTTAANVQHQYTNAKNPSKSISLTVTNSYGCTDFLAEPNALTVIAAPKVSFTASPTFVCNTTDPITFTNTTSGGTLPTTYQWTFGDGGNSTAPNPTYIYGEKGTYNVRLLATSADGCSDTSTTTAISVASSKSDITLPTLLCLNANLTFIDNSSPQTNSPIWLLDDTVLLNNGSHQFTYTFFDTKQHKLQLSNNYGVCSDTSTKIIQAQAAPVPSPFTVNIGSCSVPVTATFTDVGTGSTKWEWDFDNVNPAAFNPTAFTKTTNYTYTAQNTYYVKLRVTDASGCTGEVRQPVVIKKNLTTVSSSGGATGCKTLSTTFKASSTNPITQYNWTFTDDNSTSVLATPTHLFVNIGTFKAKLKTVTAGGCSDSAYLTIQIGNEPSFDFELASPADSVVCGNKLVTFKVTGDTDKTVGQYYWKFGDAATYTLLYNPPYTHQYSTDSLFDVSLAINNNGCNDTVTKKAFLRVLPPFPKISANINSCDDRLKVVFKESTKGAVTYNWTFGDGSPLSYDSANKPLEISHTFPSTAAYKVVLTTTNGTCTAKDSVYARVLKNQSPLLSSNQSVLCASDSLTTTVSNMQLNPYGSFFKYDIKAIQYKSGVPFTGGYSVSTGTYAVPFFPTITGLKTGNDSIRIITSSYAFNCPDTTEYIPVQISGPTAGFVVSNTSFCLSDKIFFDDTSTASSSAPITSWQWIFGDNTEQTLASGGDIFHKYTDTGSFQAKLIVTDAKNCFDTAYFSSSALTVKGPIARFSVATDPILPNTPEVFTNLTDSGFSSRINNTYRWDFGDTTFSTSNADNVTHSYKFYAYDTVKLVATSPATGCTDSATSVVHVKNTNLKFTYSLANANKICPPVLVNFQNTSVNFDPVSWDFGNGKTADSINNPSSTYDKPGTYKVTVFGYYGDNTYDSTEEYITVVGPAATIQADVIPGCGSKQVIFTAHTQSTTSLSWDFQDGTSSIDSVVTHYYNTPNVYTPVLTVKNGPLCVFSYPISTSIAIDSLHVDINLDSIKQCHQLLVNFNPAVFSIAKKNNQPVNYSWQFGDGISTSQNDTTSFTYTKPGKYPVTFIATSPYGCSDTATTEIDYNDPSHASIQGPSEFCENTPQSFNAINNTNSALTYNWQFENGTSTLQNPPPQTFSASWKDSIRLIIGYTNCADTIYHSLLIHGQPQVITTISDSTVCSGTAVAFTAKPANSTQELLTYQWNFGDGKTSTDSVVTYLYAKPSMYSPSLAVKNAGGCSASFTPVGIVSIDSLSIGINKDSVIQCHQLLVNFNPYIYSLAKNNNQALDYTWQFGDGVSSSKNDTTSFTYTKSGTYPVSFIATSPYGCTDTATTQITFADIPHATIQGPAEFCENTPQIFKAIKTNSSDVVTYNWQFENGTSTLQNPPAQTFSAAWKDSIRLIAEYNGCFDTVYHSLLIHAEPQVIIKVSDSTVCSGTSVIFDAKPASGTQDLFTYQWSFGNSITSTDSVISYAYPKSGVYSPSLFVKSTGQCSGMFTPVTKIIIDSLHISINKDSVIQCHQLMMNFKPTIFSTAKNNGETLDYNWQFGDGVSSSKQDTTSFTYTKPGNYLAMFIVSSPFGCTDTVFTAITYIDSTVATIQGSTEFCENTLQTFKAVKANNTDVLTYNWQFQNGTSTSQNPPAQTFTAVWKDSIRLIVDKNNCKDTIYQKLNIHGQPNVAIQLSDSIACLGSAIAFDAKPITALSETVNYVWDFGGGNTANQSSASFTYNNIGTYPVSLLATSAFGCIDQVKDTVTVAPVPTASITAQPDLCIGGTVTFVGSSNVASSQYFWHFSDGTTSTLQNPAPKTYTTATTDNLYLVASIGSCHDTAYHSLTVHSLPLANVTPLIPRVCLGDSVQLTAHNGQTYQWLGATFITNTSVANPYVFPAVDTKYAVQVTDNYGCKNVDSILVLVTQPQKISVVSPVNVCIGNKASLLASGTDTYNWIDGSDLDLTNVANPTTKDSAKSRTYTVKGSDAGGCFTDSATIEVIVRDKPVVDAGTDQTVPAGTSVQLSATSGSNIVSWNWQPPLYLSCNNCASPISKLRSDTVYTVQATDNYGCKGSDTVRIKVICKQSFVNVPQIFSPNGDGINDLFRMTAIGVKTITHFIIYGRNGNKVYERNNISALDKDAAWDGLSNNTYMPAGTYVYMIQAVCDAGEVYNLQGTVVLVR